MANGKTDEKPSSRAGLAYGAHRVLVESDKLGSHFDPDSVHDLRVALRRCRSMADGFLLIDPDPGWKQL
ncbi:MAG TPA: CHAD domain-containing protein, partial [Terriglobales bacterium]|nr:CHAD domain-containing protein [Terriglobales bacterium]